MVADSTPPTAPSLSSVAKHMLLGEAGLVLQITECKETEKPRGQSYGAGDLP